MTILRALLILLAFLLPIGAIGQQLSGAPPAGQTPGTATNDNAAAGMVGEYLVSAVAVGSPVPLTSNTAANVTSIVLTAGDWDVTGLVGFSPAAGTTIASAIAGITTVSGTFPPNGNPGLVGLFLAFTTGTQQQLPVGPVRVSVAAPTTVYLLAQSSFAVSTMGGYGTIRARRVR